MKRPVPVAIAMHIGAALDLPSRPPARVADVEQLVGIGKRVHHVSPAGARGGPDGQRTVRTKTRYGPAWKDTSYLPPWSASRNRWAISPRFGSQRKSASTSTS